MDTQNKPDQNRATIITGAYCIIGFHRRRGGFRVSMKPNATATLLTLLLNLSKRQANASCSLNFGSATVKNYGTDDAIIFSNAIPHSKIVLPWGCGRSQRWLKRRVDQGTTSIPKCLASVRVRCRSASQYVYEPCLQSACHKQRTQLEEKEAYKAAEDVRVTEQHLEQKSTQQINISVGKTKTFLIVALLALVVIGAIIIGTSRCDARSIKKNKPQTTHELPAIRRLDPLATIGRVNLAADNNEA